MTYDLRSIRPLSRDSMRGVEVRKPVGAMPIVEIVDPRELFVEAYQRDVRERGTNLIRKIVGDFDWSHFKMPVCVRAAEADGALVVIDGQHTAIAAATHPSIDKIPVMIVEGIDLAARAAAFVGHNRERVALTQQAIYHAEVTAGDPIASIIARACAATDVTVLKGAVNVKEKHPVGATIATGTLRTIAKRSGEEFLTRVLKILVAARRGPIKASEMSAVGLVIGSYNVNDAELANVIASKTAEEWAASVAMDATRIPLAGALATAWQHATRAIAKFTPSPPPPPTQPVRPSIPAAKMPPPGPLKVTALTGTLPERIVPERIVVSSPPPPPAPPPKLADLPIGDEKPMHEANGIAVFQNGILRRNGSKIDLKSFEAAKLVGLLVRVMPAQIPFDRLATNVFGKNDRARERIKALAEQANQTLRHANLELYSTASMMGYMIRDRV